MPSFHCVNDDVGMIFFIEPMMQLGISCVDEDHNKLFTIISNLNERVLKATLTPEETSALFEELIAYAIKHFEHEHDAFRLSNYEFADDHIKHHEELLRSLVKMKQDTTINMSTILQFLTNWLNSHILNEDLKFAVYTGRTGWS